MIRRLCHEKDASRSPATDKVYRCSRRLTRSPAKAPARTKATYTAFLFMKVLYVHSKTPPGAFSMAPGWALSRPRRLRKDG